jgi:hypothetical protein
MGKQQKLISRTGDGAKMKYLPQVISRMRWRRNKPADKEKGWTKCT